MPDWQRGWRRREARGSADWTASVYSWFNFTLAAIERLWEARPGAEEHDTLEVLALLVETYEKRVFPMEEPDPVEAIRFRLEQAGMAQDWSWARSAKEYVQLYDRARERRRKSVSPTVG